MPQSVSGTFAGVFNGKNIWGNIGFELYRQEPVPDENISNVLWNFSASANNLPFNMTGLISNEEQIIFNVYEEGTIFWDSWRWGAALQIQEETSGSQKDWIGYHQAGYLYGPSWDLFTNENFLPIVFDFHDLLWDGENSGSLTFAIDYKNGIQPVPEPGTLLLLGTGLLACLIVRLYSSTNLQRLC